MVPPNKHVPDAARNTSAKLTEEEREAIQEIRKWLKAKGNDRVRINDILVDALWVYLKDQTGKTREDIRNNLPRELWTPEPEPLNNLAVMPKRKKREPKRPL